MTTKIPVTMQDSDGVPAVHATSTPITVPTGAGTPTGFAAYGTPQFDPTGAFNTSTGRFTPQVAGWYQVNAAVDYLATAMTASYVSVLLRKNGVAHSVGVIGAASASVRVSVPDLVYLNGTTDYVDVAAAHNAAGDATGVSATLSAVLVRAA